MIDRVLLAKCETIERCVLRARGALNSSTDFMQDFDAQDIAVINISRACEACIDIAMRLIRTHKLSLPTTSSDSFLLLAHNNIIDPSMADKMTKMVGFRNVAVHAYTKIDYEIVAAVIRHSLDDVLKFMAIVVSADAAKTQNIP